MKRGQENNGCAILASRPPYWHNTRMFFRATIRRLFPVACAAVMLIASAVAHVPRAPVPRIPLQVEQPALVRNNIFLAPTNAVVLVQTNGTAALAGYNLHWPPNAVAVTGTPVIHANPLLNAATYAITTLASPTVNSGVAVAGYEIDFFGNLRNPTNPCLGAIEVVLDDDGGLIINPGVGGLTGWTSIARDGGGRIIRRIYRGCVQNLAYDGRGRLTANIEGDRETASGCSGDQ